ncbi:MAG: hypothetical protein LBB83_04450 [Treponema sp.]|jgi:hypothetical protein|nr:hypothetical protein [Treponema sp.]
MKNPAVYPLNLYAFFQKQAVKDPGKLRQGSARKPPLRPVKTFRGAREKVPANFYRQNNAVLNFGTKAVSM